MLVLFMYLLIFMILFYLGDTVYIKFMHESSSDWFYKFTVLGSRFGRFDTGYRILNGLLSTSFIIQWVQILISYFESISLWLHGFKEK